MSAAKYQCISILLPSQILTFEHRAYIYHICTDNVKCGRVTAMHMPITTCGPAILSLSGALAY